MIFDFFGWALVVPLFFTVNHMSAATATRSRYDEITLAGVSCGNNNTRLYMPLSVYQEFVSHDAAVLVSLGTVKSMVQQYICSTLSEADLARRIAGMRQAGGQEQQLVRVVLEDDSLFLVPRHFFTFLEHTRVGDEVELAVDRASMRAFMHMMASVSSDSSHTTNEQKVVAYLRGCPTFRSNDIRRIYRIILALRIRTPWVRQAIQGMRSVGETDSDDETLSVDSDSSSMSASDSAFTEGPASQFSGDHVARRKTLLGIFHSQGRHIFREMFPIQDGALAFKDQGITSLAHFSHIVSLAYSVEERDSIRSIDLSENRIQTVPADAFACFSALQELVLSLNPLKEVSEDAFRGVGRLTQLSVVDAPDIILPLDVLRHTPRLEVLFLRNSRLTSLPRLSWAPRLRVLDAAHNLLMQIPDVSMLSQLQVCNFMENAIAHIDVTRLPLRADGTLSLSTLQLNGNAIAQLHTSFFDALSPHHPLVVGLHNNPVWENLNAAPAQADFQDNGFAQFSDQEKARASLIASSIEKKLFEDTCTKVVGYTAAHHGHLAVLSEELVRARAARDIYTFLPDAGVWIYNNQNLIMLGIILISAGVGGGIGYLAKKICVSVIKRVMVGAIGAAVGAGVLSYLGINHFLKDGKIYVNYGSDSVLMTSDLKAQYVGLARITSLLSLLKQYLVATNTCLFWLSQYDELADNASRIDMIMTHVESKMHLGQAELFARLDDPTTIGMLHELIVLNPLAALRRHVADDVFEGSSLSSVDVLADADVTWFGERRLEHLKSIVSLFAQHACRVRALLVNRYLGSVDHARVCRVIADSGGLIGMLGRVVERVLQPLEQRLQAAGHAGTAWSHDIVHFKQVVLESIELINTFVQQQDILDRVRY